MRKLILIDPWLSDVGGHNFQYALDICSSAVERGYQPILAVHKDLAEPSGYPPTWTVLRAFRYGICSKHWLGPDGQNRHACDVNGRRIPPERGDRSLWVQGRALLGTVRDTFARRDRARRIEDFERGCRQVMDTIGPATSEDIAFLPSMSDFDFLGFCRFLRHDPRSLPMPWHLQFHFNFFVGRDPEYDRQEEVLERMQRQFQSALAEVPNHRLHFYATTPAMARQYNRLAAVDFQHLPYPVRAITAGAESPRHSSAPVAQEPLRVTFAGVVRREKGKKKFGSLIAAAWSDCLESGRMEFVFQAPVNQIAGMVPSNLRGKVSVAKDDEPRRAALRAAPYPLDARGYLDLIRRTDLGVFLYDSRRYFARASGILGEMLAAGTPVIAPAGCWLGDQISWPMYEHVASVASEFALEGGETEPENTEMFQCTVNSSAADLAILFPWPDSVCPGTYYEITAQFEGGSDRLVPAIQRAILGMTDERTMPPDPLNKPGENTRPVAGVLFQVPAGSTTVRISTKNAYERDQPTIPALRLVQLRPPIGHDHHPRSRVGMVAYHEQDAADLMRESLDYYAHYRESATQYRQRWLALHDPGRTLERLETSQRAEQDANTAKTILSRAGKRVEGAVK